MEKMNRSEIIKWGVVVALVAVCFLIPTSDIFTMQVKCYLAVTAFGLATMAFELLPMIVSCILMPVLWICLKVVPAATALSGWTDTTILMLMGVYFMAASLEDSGLLKRAAYRLMRIAKGKYLTLLVALTLVTMLIGVLTSGRGHLIMAPLVLGLFKSLNGDDKKLGAGLAATVLLGGCAAHPYTYWSSIISPTVAQCGDLLDPSMVTPLKVILYNSPQFLITLVMIFVTYKMFKPEGELGKISYFEEKLAEMGPLSRKEKANAVMMVLTFGLVMTADLHKLNVNLIFALVPWIVYLPFLKGADAGTLKKFNLPVIASTPSLLAIGNVASALGLGVAMANGLAGLLNGRTNIFLIMLLLMIIVFILNKLMGPMAISAVLMNPVAIMVTGMGLSVVPFVYALCSFYELIIFPYESVPYLVVFSYGMMTMKDFIKFNAIRSVITAIGLFALQIPFWMLLGLFNA